MTTHAELVAAVEKVKRAAPFSDPPIVGETLGEVLAAILNLHTPYDYGIVEANCTQCLHPCPCPTVGIVTDALRKMGALRDDCWPGERADVEGPL